MWSLFMVHGPTKGQLTVNLYELFTYSCDYLTVLHVFLEQKEKQKDGVVREKAKATALLVPFANLRTLHAVGIARHCRFRTLDGIAADPSDPTCRMLSAQGLFRAVNARRACPLLVATKSGKDHA